MKSVLLSSIFVACVTLSHQAMAQCPSALNAEQMQECIVTENAGYFYTPNATVTTSEQPAMAPATVNADTPSDGKQTIVSAKAKLQNH
jgi:hypothetical protein